MLDSNTPANGWRSVVALFELQQLGYDWRQIANGLAAASLSC